MDPGLFFDMVADGEGLRTRRGTGVFNIRGSNDRLDIRRNSFSQRVINTWNSLPDSRKGVGTVLAFKNLGRDSGVKTVTQNESPSVMLMEASSFCCSGNSNSMLWLLQQVLLAWLLLCRGAGGRGGVRGRFLH